MKRAARIGRAGNFLPWNKTSLRTAELMTMIDIIPQTGNYKYNKQTMMEIYQKQMSSEQETVLDLSTKKRVLRDLNNIRKNNRFD